MATTSSYTTGTNWSNYKSYSLWDSFASGALTGFSTGASVGGAWAVFTGTIGAIFGGIIGALFGNSKVNEELKAYRDEFETISRDAQLTRNELITTSQDLIVSTRNSIDATYGEGMYDLFDDLFQQIFSLDSSLSDILEAASVDTYYGIMGERLAGTYTADTALSLSLSDISEGYQEYLASLIRGSDTVLGMTLRQRNLEEQRLISDYYDDVEAYNLEVAQAFQSAFLEQLEADVAGATAMGEASLAQATSGIRQTGSGTNLTTMQQFQNDISKIAYSSLLNYTISQYQSTLATATKTLTESVEDIRTANAQDTLDALNSIIESYNKQQDTLESAYREIKEQEQVFDEVQAEIAEITDVLGDSSSYYSDWEEIY